MQEIYRSNDVVKLSYLQAVLEDAGIQTLIFDNYTSFAEGSIPAIQQRLMVPGDAAQQARDIVSNALRHAEDEGPEEQA